MISYSARACNSNLLRHIRQHPVDTIALNQVTDRHRRHQASEYENFDWSQYCRIELIPQSGYPNILHIRGFEEDKTNGEFQLTSLIQNLIGQTCTEFCFIECVWPDLKDCLIQDLEIPNFKQDVAFLTLCFDDRMQESKFRLSDGVNLEVISSTVSSKPNRLYIEVP